MGGQDGQRGDGEGSVHSVASSMDADYTNYEGVEEDVKVLQSMGYKQELMRGFGATMSFAFCFTSVAVMSSISISWSSIMATGGPDVALYAWMICAVSTVIVGLAMAEICSTYPSAGSVYAWAGLLAPPSTSAMAAYICGWFNFLGNAAGDASFAFGFASVVQSAVAYTKWDPVTQASGDPLTLQQTVAVSIAVAFAWALLNVLRVDQQGWINNFAMVWQIVTTIVIVICVLAIPAKDADVPSNWIWTYPYNATGLDNSHFGYIMLLGLLFACFSFSGYEAGAHMAEETRNATRSSAIGIVATCCTVGLLGFIYIIGLLYATTSTMGETVATFIANGGTTPASTSSSTSSSSDPGLPTVGLYLTEAMGRVSSGGISYLYMTACGATTGRALIALLIINLFFAGVASLTVTSRIAYAMARDGAFPFSRYLSPVHPVLKTPIPTVVLVFVVDALLLLLPLGSTTAFYAITSITVIGYQVSYAIPIILRFTTGRREFRQCAFNLGRYSMAIHIYAGVWLVLTSIIFFWPYSFPVNSQTMNYTVVVVAATFFFAGIYWVLYARHTYQGPKARAAAVAAATTTPVDGSGYGKVSDAVGGALAVRVPTSTSSAGSVELVASTPTPSETTGLYQASPVPSYGISMAPPPPPPPHGGNVVTQRYFQSSA